MTLRIIRILIHIHWNIFCSETGTLIVFFEILLFIYCFEYCDNFDSIRKFSIFIEFSRIFTLLLYNYKKIIQIDGIDTEIVISIKRCHHSNVSSLYSNFIWNIIENFQCNIITFNNKYIYMFSSRSVTIIILFNEYFNLNMFFV